MKNIRRAAAVILAGGLLTVGGASAAQASTPFPDTTGTSTLSLPVTPCLIVGGCPITFPDLPGLPGLPTLPELPELPFLPSGS